MPNQKHFTVLLLLFFLSNNIQSQEKQRRFYWEISPNYSLAKMKSNDEKIKVRVSPFPLFSFGIGYFYEFKSELHIDISLDEHLWLHSSYSKVLQHQGSSIYGSPLLATNVGYTFKNNSQKTKLLLGAGIAIAYSDGYYELLTVNDTLSNMFYATETNRSSMLTSFMNVYSGLFITGKKRNYIVKLQYSYGFQVPYTVKYTRTIQQNNYYAEVTARDSFIEVSIKMFLKNRETKKT